jgi:hypothetical protein
MDNWGYSWKHKYKFGLIVPKHRLMKINKKIELTEKDVIELIKAAVETETGEEVKSIRFATVIRGDHDMGTATDHIETVYVDMK